MSKKVDYEVGLPPYTVEEIDFKTLQAQTFDYWHALSKTAEAFKDTKGEGVVVFVLDTTFKTSHPDLQENLLPEFAKSFINGPGDEDTQGHGIHCLGLVGAADNTIGVVGAAPKVKLIPVRVLNNAGQGSWQSVANGIRYAADVDLGKYNAYPRIISMSLGGSGGSEVLRSAMAHAVQKGCYPICAAGNSGYNGGDTINYPGAYDEFTITVGSISKSFQPSSFSSAGKALDVVSFGESILSTYKNNTYARLTGTSMATPIVAGLAALILSKYSNVKMSLAQLEAYLKMYAKDLGEPGEDVRTGAGAVIIDEYFKNAPNFDDPVDEDPNDDDPVDEDPKDDEPVFVKPERKLEFIFTEDFSIVWGTSIAPRNVEDVNVSLIGHSQTAHLSKRKTLFVKELKLSVTSTQMADKHYDELFAALSNFFANRGLVLFTDSDFRDAAFWTVHFLNLIFKKAGIQFEYDYGVFKDEAGRTVVI